MVETKDTADYTSIGCLAGQIQHPVKTIDRTASKLGIIAALRLNNVPHFNAAQVEQITAALREGDAK